MAALQLGRVVKENKNPFLPKLSYFAGTRLSVGRRKLSQQYFTALCCFMLKQQILQNITAIKLPPCSNLFPFTCHPSDGRSPLIQGMYSLALSQSITSNGALQTHSRQYHQFFLVTSSIGIFLDKGSHNDEAITDLLIQKIHI